MSAPAILRGRRNDLTVLERGEHLARREEIMAARGQRAEPGDNQHSGGGELNSPPRKTTAEIAREAGISERTAQHYKQISRDLDPEVKDQLRDTPTANNKTDLLKLSRLDHETQRAVAVPWAILAAGSQSR